MAKRRNDIVRLSPKDVRRGAYILGEHSSYAKALREYERRLGRGIKTEFYSVAGVLIVGDPVPNEAAMRKMEA